MKSIIKKIIILSIALHFQQHSVFSQKKTIPAPTQKLNENLVSGPMISWIEHESVCIWLEVNSKVKKIDINYREKENSTNFKTVEFKGKLGKEYNPIQVIITGLAPGKAYDCEVLLDNIKQELKPKLNFTTKKNWEWRESAPDFSFLLGSCTYINDSLYDRPGKPYGQSSQIFNTMFTINSDFMLWTGDNTYLREADYSSEYGIERRYSHTRKNKDLQRLFISRPNYATWDDHDFGPNDGNYTYDLKNKSAETFKNYWPAKSYKSEGVYTKFTWSDAEFFLLDDRYFRSANEYPDSVNGKPNPAKTFLGNTQLEWLKNSLISSKATFKFIVCGSQVQNKLASKELFCKYSFEYNDLMSFITNNKIEGVLFISGDRHFTELLKFKPNADFYNLYEYTCSPLTSSVHDISKSKELNNPNRIEGSLIQENNFGKIEIKGAKNNRELSIITYSASGTPLFEYKINEKQLKAK